MAKNSFVAEVTFKYIENENNLALILSSTLQVSNKQFFFVTTRKESTESEDSKENAIS